MTIEDDMVYLTDNARALCGKDLGHTAKTTGRDVSGRPITPVSPAMVEAARINYGHVPACEKCGREARGISPFGFMSDRKEP